MTEHWHAWIECEGMDFEPEIIPYVSLLFEEGERMRVFYRRGIRIVYERVSKVDKRRIFLRIRDKMIKKYGYYMKKSASFMTGLRIDTDFSSWEEVKKAISILSGFPATVFVHVSAIKEIEPVEGIEFGLHCYEHREFEDEKEFEEDIRRGVEFLKRKGIEVRGYASPYGFYRSFFPQVLEKYGFLYSSSFSFMYDLPPIRNGKVFEVPVHPVAPERFVYAGISLKYALEYFYARMLEAERLGFPFLVYTHPRFILENPEFMRDLIEILNYGEPVSMFECLNKWRERKKKERVKPGISSGADFMGEVILKLKMLVKEKAQD